ncbi:MAG: outer membrane lipoprotein carrier protein LolA [Flavobacteriaceae bacterium]|nr:outer membrane lipoprotein carrier protein LolA [Flavobacteriaceae bacterium]
MIKRIILLGCFLIGSGAMAQQNMTASEVNELKETLKERATQVRTIKSSFVQHKHLDFLANDITSTGFMLYQKPNKVKWTYTKPYKYSVIFKENRLLVDDDGTKSDMDMGANKLFKKLNEFMISSVHGNMFDDAQFYIQYKKNNKHYWVQLQPRDVKLKQYIAQFELFFNKKTATVMEVKIVEPSQDYTHIIFSNRKENLSLSDAEFSH